VEEGAVRPFPFAQYFLYLPIFSVLLKILPSQGELAHDTLTGRVYWASDRKNEEKIKSSSGSFLVDRVNSHEHWRDTPCT